MVRLSPVLSLYLVLLAPVFGLDNNVLALKQLRREMEYTKEGILNLVRFAEDIGPFLKLLVKVREECWQKLKCIFNSYNNDPQLLSLTKKAQCQYIWLEKWALSFKNGK